MIARPTSSGVTARHNDEMVHQALKYSFDATNEILVSPREFLTRHAEAGAA